MADKKLFQEFEPLSSKQWKQQVQYELKGADYNQTLVWESPEGIKVKPFYHPDETAQTTNTSPGQTFRIVQAIYVHDVALSNKRAKDSLARGAESIYFTLEDAAVDLDALLEGLAPEPTYYFRLPFLSAAFCKKLSDLALRNKANYRLLNDPIGQLCKEGNWFSNLEGDMQELADIATQSGIPFLAVSGKTYQQAGANMVQQLACMLGQLNEYFNRITAINQPITLEVSVGANYFFEIAKLRALRLLFDTLATEYGHSQGCHIIATPSRRNKALYDYNVNMLRTTTESMAAILGGADAVANLPYDALYHKDNEFGDRIARNQLLILKHESYFDKVGNAADGAYYIEELTRQLADKALILFKEMETKGGLITQLIGGSIQKKIQESAQKEQELFDSGKEVLLGTNKYPNPNDRMKGELELYPFVKQNPRKTLITPIIEKRLAEKTEQDRLAQETP